MFQSETFALIDAMYFDDCISSDTTSNYYINNSGGTSLTHTANGMVLSLGTNNWYVRLSQQSWLINDSFKVEVTLKCSNQNSQWRLRCYRGETTYATSSYLTGDATHTLEVSVPDVAYSNIEIGCKSSTASSGDTVTITDFKVYKV